MTEETKLANVSSEGVVASFKDPASFDFMQRQAKLMAASKMVPEMYQNNLPNCVVALEIASRIGASPLAVMQNLYIIKGKPSWSAQFIIGIINTTKKFTPLRFKVTGTGDDMKCIAHADDVKTGETLIGPTVTIKMAKLEGWGKKWQTMPELMLQYRAAAFFGRLYAPEVLMGMLTREEVADINEKVEVLAENEPEGGTRASNIVKKAQNTSEDAEDGADGDKAVETATDVEVEGKSGEELF